MSDHRQAKYTHLPAYVVVYSSALFSSLTVSLPEQITNYSKVWIEDWVIDGVPVQGITDFPVDTHFLLRFSGDLDRNHHTTRYQNDSHLFETPVVLNSQRTTKSNANPILVYHPEEKNKSFPIKKFQVELLTPAKVPATFTACCFILKFD